MTNRLRDGLLVVLSTACLSLAENATAAQPPTETQPTVVCPDGAWCWYQDERAIYVGHRLLVGSVSRTGDVQASILPAGSTNAQTITLHAALQTDDHAAPSFVQLDTGPVIAFYSKHGSDDLMRSRTCLSTNDLTAWQPETTNSAGSGVTYSNPFQLSDESGKLYLFFRGPGIDPHYWSSTNRGDTWDGPLKLIESPGHRPYVKYASDGSNTIHFVYTEGHPDEYTDTSIYHMYYRAGGLYRSDGTFITNLTDAPVPPEAGTKIYDGTSPTGEAWTWDVHLDTNGFPVVPYATFAARNPDDHRYRYARWDGTQWHDHEIARAGTRLYTGQASYSGGICVDPEQPNVVYIAADVDITNGTPNASGHYELYRGETADMGASWTWRALTRDSLQNNLRPIVPIGHTNETDVLWMRGTYTTFTSYDLEIVGLFGSNVVVEPVRPPEPPPAWTGYAIDLNDSDNPMTKDGWTGLNVDHGTGAGSVMLHDVTFSTFSADGARLRLTGTTPNPDSLLGDFAFDDGINEAVGLACGGAGELAAGNWLVDVYINDAENTFGPVIVGYRRDAQDVIVSTNVAASSTGPAITFALATDGVSAYDVFVRENNSQNRSRLNAVRLRTTLDAPCAYAETVAAQAPLAYYRLGTATGTPGGALRFNMADIRCATPAPALNTDSTPPFAGLGVSNTWANLDGSLAGYLSELATNWNSDAGSVTFWLRLDADGVNNTQTGLFGRQSDGGGTFGGGLMSNALATFIRTDGSFGITIDNNQRETAAGRMTMNEWHHLAYTWQRNSGLTDGVVRIYIDGVEEAGFTNVSWSSFTIDEARFGQEISGTTRKLDGSVDELAIWTRPLSGEDILTQYWRAMKPLAVVALAEGFQGSPTTSGGGGAPLGGWNGWVGAGIGVRRDLQTWSRMGGEWAYGSGENTKVIGAFVTRGGTVTLDFCGRANGRKSLFSLGVDDGAYSPLLYFGVEGANVRVMPYDGTGATHDTRTTFASSETELIRMRLEVALEAGTASMAYYDGAAWQSPEDLQGLDVSLHSGRAANTPENWNAVAINGTAGAAWDNLCVVYEPTAPPLGGTLLLVR